MNRVDDALRLARLGFHVFPLQEGKKLPAIGNFPELATRDEAQIHRWFFDDVMGIPRHANVGISTTRYGDPDEAGDYRALLVIDVDDKPAADGKPAKQGGHELVRLEMAGMEFPSTMEQQTPSGGAHLIYVTPYPVKQGTNVLAPGLDIRSGGGYIVGAGSITEKGEYRSIDRPIAEAPAWLVERCGRRMERDPALAQALLTVDAARATERAAAYLRDEAEGAMEGAGGDAHTLAVAQRVGDFGVGEAECLELMLDWNEKCAPAWSSDDLAAKVANAYRYRTRPVGCAAPEAEFQAIPATALAQVTGAAPLPARRSLIAVPFRNIALPTKSAWLVKDWLDQGGLSVLYGDSNSGKTFCALDMALHVAQGKPWFDKRVRGGPVVYLAAEGGGSVGRRIVAFKQHYELGDKDIPFVLMPCAVDLLNPSADTPLLAQAMTQAAERYGQPVALLIVDTLSRATAGGDENSAQDMTRFIANLDHIRQATGAHVQAVHHTGKDASKGARGHSSLRAAVDTAIEVDATGGGHRVTVTKQRDMEFGQPLAFRLLPLQLGTDEDGEAITSCVVTPISDFMPLPKSVVNPGTHAAEALGILRTLIDSEGRPGASGGIIVPVDRWREAFISGRQKGVRQDSADRKFREVRTALSSGGHVVQTGEFIGLAP